jgi:hypothetical protein
MQRYGASVMRLAGGMKGIAPAVGYRFDLTNDGRCGFDRFSCSLRHAGIVSPLLDLSVPSPLAVS